MKAVLFILLLLLTGFLSTAQVKAVIVDGNSKEKIPYVNIWVENENIGTTSNEAGEFELNITVQNDPSYYSKVFLFDFFIR